MQWSDDGWRSPASGQFGDGPGQSRATGTGRGPDRGTDRTGLWVTLGTGALLGAVGYAVYQGATRNHVAHRPDDDAPARTARRGPQQHVSGRTVTIDKPRHELFAFWRDGANLSKFMEGVQSVSTEGGVMRWTIASPTGPGATIESRITEERAGELIAWRSTDASQIAAEGRVTFRDAPAGRGTEVEATLTYHPPFGDAGRWIARLFRVDPAIQGRRDLKRFKMLMETGEIATSRNRNS